MEGLTPGDPFGWYNCYTVTTSVKWGFFDVATVTLSVTNYNRECDKGVVAATGNQVDLSGLIVLFVPRPSGPARSDQFGQMHPPIVEVRAGGPILSQPFHPPFYP